MLLLKEPNRYRCVWDDENGKNAWVDGLSEVYMTTEKESIYCVMSANIHSGALILACGLYQHPHLTPNRMGYGWGY